MTSLINWTAVKYGCIYIMVKNLNLVQKEADADD